jgi:probable phosphoglycerate mutase
VTLHRRSEQGLPFEAEPAAAVVAYIDGGARGNPGPAGFGVRVEQADGTLIEEFSEAIGTATNNVAEYRGLLAALASCTCGPTRCCSCSRCSATTR